MMDGKKYICSRCNKPISRIVECCTHCLREFHPKCANEKSHRIYDNNNELIPCPGPFEIYNLKAGKKEYKRRRTLSGGYNKDEEILMDDNSSTKNANDHNSNSKNNNNAEEAAYDNTNLDATFNICENNNNNSNNNLYDKIASKVFYKINNLNENNMKQFDEIIKKYVRLEIKHVTDVIKENMRSEFSLLISEMKNEISDLKAQINKTSSVDKINDDLISNENNRLAIHQNKHGNERIIIKSATNTNDKQILNEITSKINVEKLDVGVNKIISKPNGNVVIDLERETDKIKLTNEIEKTFGKVYKIVELKKKNPFVKIIGFDAVTIQLDNEQILNNLCKQNRINRLSTGGDNIKIVKKYLTKKGYGSIILEVSATIHKFFLQQGKAKYGWNNYKVYDYINILQCYNCWGFNHLSYKCTKQQSCRICAQSHSHRECKSSAKKCVNCLNLSRKFNNNDIKLNHEATDKECECYKKIVNKLKNDIVSNKQ